jgi:hypothetical protein
MSLLKGYLYSSLLKGSYSTNKLSILMYLEVPYKLVNTLPLFNAKISYDDDFCLYNDLKCSGSKIMIDKNYLLTTFKHKYPEDNIYLPLKDISSISQEIIISTEDPLFRSHKGVCPEFVGFALRENILKKKFIRGASTITMQLVKNLFLNQKRIASRKLEEVIISLLLENVFNISKNDILELYLNIIEFAPNNIYGIENAALFYFSKHYSELNIIEMIILTYIIPRPTSFYNTLLIQPEHLNLDLYSHIRTYTNVLISKKIITLEDLISVDTRNIYFSERFNNYHLIINLEDSENRRIINTLHPSIRQEVSELVQLVNSKLTVSKMILTTGLRTFEEQEQLFKKHPNVTNAKAGQSYHNYGLAFDFCLSISGVNVWDEFADYDNDGIYDWSIVVDIFKNAGYFWGGNFKNLHDASHFEKTFSYSWKELYGKYIKGNLEKGYVAL